MSEPQYLMRHGRTLFYAQDGKIGGVLLPPWWTVERWRCELALLKT